MRAFQEAGGKPEWEGVHSTNLLDPLVGRSSLIAFETVPVADRELVKNLVAGAGTRATIHRAIVAGDFTVLGRSLKEIASVNGAGSNLDGLGNGSCCSIGVCISGWGSQDSHRQKGHGKDGYELHGWVRGGMWIVR